MIMIIDNKQFRRYNTKEKVSSRNMIKGDVMKNILICNNAMVIGGVETVILNQITAFTKKGYNVYVIAGKGIYSKKVEELGGHFIECDFPEENEINIERVNKIVTIIKENQITEIHIHKYQCVLSVIPAALITGVPYFAYEHGIRDTKKYYTWNYPIYKLIFPLYFNSAYKIIAITPKVAEFTQKDYNIPKEKYEIIHNGIDFDIYKNSNPKYEGNIEKVAIVSRVNDEKLTTILEGIEIFKKILEKYPDARLEIIGGGNAEDKLEEVLKNKKLDYAKGTEKQARINLLGEQNNVEKYLKQSDLLLGVDRCVLEAIAMKVPAVITGYEGIKGLVTKENINLAIEENFSGDNMNTININDCINQIIELENNRKEIVEENYKIATEKLDCYKNYINIPEDKKVEFDWLQLFEILKKCSDKIEEQSVDIKAKYEWIQKIEKENKELWKIKGEKEKVQEENEKIQEEKQSLQKELNEVYNSKRWKYTDKISKLLHKGK